MVRRTTAEDLYVYKAVVVRIVDGDTCVLNADLGCGMWLHNERCRLAGINTPEIFGGVQPGGLEAKLWLEHEIEKCGGNVIIRTEKSRDKFGRWLAWIFPPVCEVSLNEQMVKLGLAKKYQD